MFGLGASASTQRADDLVAGRVEGVQDAPLRVAAFAAEIVVGVLRIGAQVEVGTERDQLADALRSLAHDELDDLAVAESGTGDQRVVDVRLRSCPRGSTPRRCRPARSGWSSPAAGPW